MRDIDTDALGAFQANGVRLVRLVQLDFDSGPLRLFSWLGTLRWAGADWIGAGILGRMGPIEEASEVRATSVEFTLSGMPAEVIDIAKTEAVQGRPASAWIAGLDQQGRLIGEPVRVLRGRMDSLEWTEGPTTSFRLTVETSLVDLERARVRRFTDNDLRARYPDDRGAEYIAAMVNAQLSFGRE